MQKREKKGPLPFSFSPVPSTQSQPTWWISTYCNCNLQCAEFLNLKPTSHLIFTFLIYLSLVSHFRGRAAPKKCYHVCLCLLEKTHNARKTCPRPRGGITFIFRIRADRTRMHLFTRNRQSEDWELLRDYLFPNKNNKYDTYIHGVFWLVGKAYLNLSIGIC